MGGFAFTAQAHIEVFGVEISEQAIESALAAHRLHAPTPETGPIHFLAGDAHALVKLAEVRRTSSSLIRRGAVSVARRMDQQFAGAPPHLLKLQSGDAGKRPREHA